MNQPKNKLQAWYLATRPRVFVASLVPMGLVMMLALQDNTFQAGYFVLSLMGVLCLQTAANLINEYADFVRGADTLKQAGQGMTIKNQILSPQEVRNGAIFSVAGGCLIGLYLLSQSGPLLWVIGISGVLVAITYTAGPFPLAYNGLGEIAAGVFMGPMIVLGGYYVMNPTVSSQRMAEIILISLPILFLTAAILHANNVRDLEADKSVNKRTLAVIFGRRTARIEYALLTSLAYVTQVALIVAQYIPITTVVTFLTLPVVYRLNRMIFTQDDPLILHQAQTGTAKLHGRYGLLFVLGWMLSVLMRL